MIQTVLNLLAGKRKAPEKSPFSIPDVEICKRFEENGSLALPRALFAQPGSQTEWWYYTAHCESESSRRFGFELVFFRRKTDNDRIALFPLKVLANPMFAAHFAVTDIGDRSFRYADRRGSATRFSPFESEARFDRFQFVIGDWGLFGDREKHHLYASIDPGIKLSANLKSVKPPALNGHGVPSGDPHANTSTHFSYTRMRVDGVLSIDGSKENFSGSAWMDREYGTWVQRNWDWFSIQLEDQTELMLYQFRDKSDLTTSRSHGNFVDRSGKCKKLTHNDFEINVERRWRSPHTGIDYPSAWNVKVPHLGIELEIEPFIEDQELNTEKSTMIVYWEGACSVKGISGSTSTKGNAYVELVGYDRGSFKPTLRKFIKGLF